ncbi:MAG: calcium-binding protein [Planctomycetes bacterium]|nr:calcium-binding protein [Planctomycetota bacterium]
MSSQHHWLQRQRAAFRPRFERLERRDYLSCTVFQRGETLVILGDREANQIAIADTREGEIVLSCDRREPQRFAGVAQIVVETFGGDDDVTAELICPADPSFHFRADLGAGDDRLSISGFDPQPDPPLRFISFDILAGAGNDEVTAVCPSDPNIHFRADPGAGDDRLSISGFDPQPDPPLRTVAFDIRAGAGNDEVMFDLAAAEINGRFVVSVSGGIGNDRLMFGAIQPCILPESEMRIVLSGDAGDDLIDVSMTGLEIAGELDLRAHGGAGNDVIESFIVPCILPEGRANILVDGQAGNDNIAARVEMDEDSRGLLAARVLGGLGDDDLTLEIYGVDEPSLLTALVDGGCGYDIARVTRNVRVGNCEEVFFLDEPR